jgi:hypothetical protein
MMIAATKQILSGLLTLNIPSSIDLAFEKAKSIAAQGCLGPTT